MSLFGEIVEPASRTIWEDWDDVLPERDDSKLQWQNKIDINQDIDTFYFIDGKYLKHFIDLQSQQLQLINEIKEVNLRLYKIKLLHKYLCTIKDYDIVLSSEIVQLLEPYLESCKNIITIQTIPISEYRSTQFHVQPCVIRGLYTSAVANKSEFEFPKLEQPNIISGVVAGVISLRERLNQNGIALICYMENTDDYQVEELQKLFNKLDLGSVYKPTISNVISSNLYI
ncbi:PREDICTED: uncharacterized protein LOC106121981 [Papilio xuthus]|uniref:Proteasome assembly chaperone 1 n=1 Tax=Papilio xuthus TaxID=66420 RepID=A0A194PL36_PAPXU|nr:PREDICTED: uncharacterized protein LOC106121981 [Papilio xuthus]KPI94042.1 hypothetical protein RR46_13207 [Papilio xuthus]